MPTAADMHELEEKLEDHERQLGLATDNIHLLQEKEKNSEADLKVLQEKLDTVQKVYTKEKEQEVNKLQAELHDLEKEKERLRERVQRYENSCASKMCVVQ